MTVYEMEGFLRGKCIPRDLKVNETNAEYLVRKFAEAEAKCAALAALNAAMHETIEAVRSVADNSSGIAGWHLNGDIATWEEILPEINDIETQATDAFLAEVRAQGVDMARNAMIDFVDGEVGPNKNVPGLIRGAEICVSIAEQLRKRCVRV